MKFTEQYNQIVEKKQLNWTIKGVKYFYDKKLNSGKAFEQLSNNDNIGMSDADGEQKYVKKSELMKK